MVISSATDLRSLTGLTNRAATDQTRAVKPGLSTERPDVEVRARPAAESAHAAAVANTRGVVGDLLRADAALQVADRAYEEIGGKLAEMQAVARQATGETLSTLDRAVLDTRFQEFKDEIGGVAGDTDFDGEKILAGGQGAEGQYAIRLGVGGEDGKGTELYIPPATVDSISPEFGGAGLLTREDALEAVRITGEAIEEVDRRRDAIASQRRTVQEMMATEREQNALLNRLAAPSGQADFVARISASVVSAAVDSGGVPFADSADRLREILGGQFGPSDGA